MTVNEANWAFENEVRVKLEIDPIQKRDALYEYIVEIGKAKDRQKKVYVFAVCKDMIANSVTTTKVSEVKFAKKEDEERCHRELGIQNTAVS